LEILSHISNEPEFEPVESYIIVNKAALLKLLEKYREGTMTEAENALLIDYYEAFEDGPDALAALDEAGRKALKDGMLDAIWKRIDGSETPGSS